MLHYALGCQIFRVSNFIRNDLTQRINRQTLHTIRLIKTCINNLIFQYIFQDQNVEFFEKLLKDNLTKYILLYDEKGYKLFIE